MSSISHSLQAWATALGMERRTLESHLVKSGDVPRKREKLSAKRVFQALSGGKYEQQVRILKAEANRKEREEQEAKALLVKMPDVEARLSETLVVPLLTMLNSLGTTLDTRCNPTDPELARQAIEEHVERTMKPQLLSSISKLKTTS